MSAKNINMNLKYNCFILNSNFSQKVVYVFDTYYIGY